MLNSWYATGTIVRGDKHRHQSESSEADRKRNTALAEEALQVAQWLQHSTAASALAQVASRFGTGRSEFAGIVRGQQDLLRQLEDLDDRLGESLKEGRNLPDQEQLVARIKTGRSRLAEVGEQIKKQYPAFADLVMPSASNVGEISGLLNGEEVLVFFVSGIDQTFVWAVTRDGIAWESAAIGAKAIGDKLAALRTGLDRQACRARGLARTDEPKRNCDDVGALPFDPSLAHDLYKTLLGPVESVIKDKTHLIIVPSGPLTSLPFEVLVTEAPKAGSAGPAAFQEAQWLVKRHALTVLPAVSSLRALRVFAKASQAAKPFVGFGDPEFEKWPAGSQGAKERQRLVSAIPTRGLSEYFRGALADNSILHQLPPLPETAEELVLIAKSVGAAESDLMLGRAASETKVKAMSVDGQLSQYRVAAFATHALVAGEIKGLAEPGLVLTVPDEATGTDDGLLTASEVAQLKLDADWVVLSACNTAAGDKPGAEALSGLAKAFFYAGARSLLVSHWPVESQAATFLTTRTFKEMREAAAAGKPIGRAEALRRSELALMATPGNAHPAIWAPFMVVGEGGAAR